MPAPKPNAFFLFAQNLKNTQGRKFKSMKEACEAAGPLWAQMSKKQQEPWVTMAKRAKGQAQRLTSEGLNVEELTKEQKLEMEREERMKQSIRNVMIAAQAKGDRGVAEETFFLIHFNIFCYHAAEDTYYPAEIGVVAFSLKTGVRPENVYHDFVHPGPLPFGFKFEAKQISAETHQIKVDMGDNQENNCLEVFQNLIQFLEKKKPSGTKRMPVLYADGKNVKMIRQILNQWCLDYTDNEESLFKVHSLPLMFQYLKNTVAGEEAYPTITIPIRELERDIYAYNTDIACTYHSTTEHPQFCSKSVVSRYAYVICDCCCTNLGIPLEPGFHVPNESVVPENSAASVASFGSESTRSIHAGPRRRKRYESDVSDTDSTTNDTWETQSLLSNSTTTASTLNTADDFPALGSGGKSSNPFLKSSSQGSSTNKGSYAGATGGASYGSTTGPTLPSGFTSSFNNISLANRSRPQTAGRGFRPKHGSKSGDDSESICSESDVTPVGYASSCDGDFPPIGKGRGRGFVAALKQKKPGAQVSKGNNDLRFLQ